MENMKKNIIRRNTILSKLNQWQWEVLNFLNLDSYSKQVFIYLDPILIYISLWIDCLFEIRKIAVFPLAFIAGWLQGHWWGFISRNDVVWPTFLLMNVLIALKGSHFWFLVIEKPHGDFRSKLPHRKKTPWEKYEFYWPFQGGISVVVHIYLLSYL